MQNIGQFNVCRRLQNGEIGAMSLFYSALALMLIFKTLNHA